VGATCETELLEIEHLGDGEEGPLALDAVVREGELPKLRRSKV
jgi:hypothetical protein